MEIKNTPTPVTRKRMTKTRRLENSLKINQTLLNILHQRQDMEKKYFEKQIDFIDDQRNHLREQQNFFIQGLGILKELKDGILKK